MGSSSPKRRTKGTKKVRVAFRRNRSKRARDTDWTRRAREAEDHEVDADRGESVTAKGDLSRRRTITVRDNDSALEGLHVGTVVAMRGLFADVDAGQRVYPCTVRRVLRTRLTGERNPVTVGDRVRFRLGTVREGVAAEGVIEAVEPRHGQLQRLVDKRVHTMVANVDYAIIVTCADEPAPKPHLIDRYIVASHAGRITPVICLNKTDLDRDGAGKALMDRYKDLGYSVLYVSAVTGDGIAAVRDALRDRSSVLAGQSGVGKSTILNAVEPGLRLQTGSIVKETSKGRHTTTTASLIALKMGGYVVDTPGIKSFDLSIVPRNELEMHFVEFVEHVTHCKFADCTHTHEKNCAVKQAVETGLIHPERYESYVRLFEEPAAPPRCRNATK